MALLNFNAADHNVQQAFEALPKGWYQAKLVESDIKATSTGGQQLTATAEILAPEWAKNRKVFLRYNINNTNQDCVRIAMEQLATLSMAIGIPQWSDSCQLHNHPFLLKLKVVKGNDQYEDSNDAAGYDSINVDRQLAVQPGKPKVATPMAGMFPSAPAFPGAAQQAPAQQAPVQQQAMQAATLSSTPVQGQASVPPSNPVTTGTAPAWAGAAQPWQQPATQQPAAQQMQAPVQQQQPVQQTVTQQPVQQQAMQTLQGTVQQEAQPVAQPEAQQTATVQQAALQPAWAQPAQQAVQQQPEQAPVQQQVQQAEAQQVVQAPAAAAPWANQTVQPTPPQQSNAAPAQAEPTEVHPAQSATPPWQVPAQA